MKKIESSKNAYIKSLKLLSCKKHMLQEKKFLIEGNKIIEIAKNTNNLLQLLTTNEDEKFDNTIIVNNKIIKTLSSYKTHQGNIGVCKLRTKKLQQYNRIIVLDNVNMPTNVGAIIRSAVAFGFDAIVVSTETAFPWSLKAITASQGAIFNIDIIQTNIKSYLTKFKYFKIASSLDDSSIYLKDLKLNFKENIALIVGNEAIGVSKDILEICNTKIKIPIKNIESLNVAVATGIFLHYIS